MSSISPNTSTTRHEDEDQVVFKSSPPASSTTPGGAPQRTSPPQAPAPVGTGSKRSSLGVIAPQQPPFSPSPLLLGGDVHSQNGNGNSDQAWDISERLRQMQLNPAPTTATTNSSNNTGATSKEAVFPNLNDGYSVPNGDSGVISTLAPPADLTSDKQPHSRQSSNGTTSSVQDSPTVPTPAPQKSNQGTVHEGKPFASADPYNNDPYASYQAAVNDFVGAAGGRTHPGATHFSPINGNFASIAGQPTQQQQNAASQFGFGFHSPPQTHDLPFAGMNGATNGIGQSFNAQRLNGVTNGSGFTPYGSPPPNGYPTAGMMSPTLASPTFLPSGLNPYASPVLHPQANPYSAYTGAGFEIPPGSPVLSPQAHFAAAGGANAAAGAGLGRQGPFTPPPNQYGRGRGQGMHTSAPTGNTRGGANAGGPTTPNRGGRAPRGRGTGSQMMMSPAAAYGSPYGPPLSPTPYDSTGFGVNAASPTPNGTTGSPQTSQVFQPQATNPELASLMLQMAAAGYQQGMMSPYAIANGGPGVGMSPNFMSMGMSMGMFNGMDGAQTQDWTMEGGPVNWPMGMGSPASAGPSANNRKLGLYKTELCRSFEEKGECRYGDKCQFAHGDTEQRKVERHPKYKTEICRTFWVSGSCPYGKRCCFIHTELPTNAAANGGGSGAGEGANTPANQNGNNNTNGGDTRNRSMSTNSDPNDPPSSLLARISAKAQANNIARSSDAASPAANSSSATTNSGQPTEAVVAAAINRAMAKFGAPDPSVTVIRKLDIHPTPPPPPVEVVPVPKVPAVFSNFPVGGSSGTGGGGGLSAGGHHRMSASVDFGRVSRNLGSDLNAGYGGGGHARNPSASSVVTNSLMSRSPNPAHSGHSTPYGNSTTPNNGISNGIQTSSLLDRTWA